MPTPRLSPHLVLALGALAVIATIGPLPAAAQPAAGAPTAPASSDPADVDFRRANELAKAKQWREALDLYQRAFAARRAWDIAANMALAELELDRPRDAAEHLEFALRHIAATAKPEHKALLQAAFGRARARVGAARVRTSADGATVRVDGVTVGTSPLIAPVFLTPGRHRIEASSASAGTAARDLEALPGQEVDVWLDLQPSGAASPVGPPPDTGTDPRAWWPIVALGSGAAIGIGLGLGLTIASSSASDEAVELAREVEADGGRCTGEEQAGPCFEGREANDRSNTLGTGGVVAFVVGGLCAAGLVTYIVWPSADGATAGTAVVPYASPDGAGAVVRAGF